MTDFIAFDDAVKVAVDFAKADGETLVLAFPDHNTGGPKIGNYGKSYTDVSLERLRDPFLGMTMTANGLTRSIPRVNTTNQDVVNTVFQHWGINMTEQDVVDIYDYKTTARQSLSYSIAKLVSERYTEIGWTTHGHNGESGTPKDCSNKCIVHTGPSHHLPLRFGPLCLQCLFGSMGTTSQAC